MKTFRLVTLGSFRFETSGASGSVGELAFELREVTHNHFNRWLDRLRGPPDFYIDNMF